MLENLPLGSLRKPPSHFLSRGSTLFSLSYETPLNITEAKGTNLFVSEWTFIFAPNISIVSHHHEVLLPSFLLQEERCLSYKSEIKWKVIEEVTNLHHHQSINQSINQSIDQSNNLNSARACCLLLLFSACPSPLRKVFKSLLNQ